LEGGAFPDSDGWLQKKKRRGAEKKPEKKILQGKALRDWVFWGARGPKGKKEQVQVTRSLPRRGQSHESFAGKGGGVTLKQHMGLGPLNVGGGRVAPKKKKKTSVEGVVGSFGEGLNSWSSKVLRGPRTGPRDPFLLKRGGENNLKFLYRGKRNNQNA